MKLPMAIMLAVIMICVTVLGAIALTQIPGPVGRQGVEGPAGHDGRNGTSPTKLRCFAIDGDIGTFTCQVVDVDLT